MQLKPGTCGVSPTPSAAPRSTPQIRPVEARHWATSGTPREVASRLRTTAVGRDLFVDAHEVRSLERNRPVSGWNWRKPGYSSQLVHQLAAVYGVPVRMVVDA